MSADADKDDDQALAAEYALGLMSAEETAAFEARLASEPPLRTAYAQWAEDFAAMAEDIAEETPPSRVRVQINAQLFPDARPERRSWFDRFGPGILVAGALAAVLFLTVDLPGQGVSPPLNPTYTSDIATEDGSLVVLAGYDAKASELYVERVAGAARPGRALELWLIAGDNPPVSLGVLPEDKAARLSVSPELVAALEGGVLAISDEPSGGSPTGAPTGEVLATAPLSNV
ncbi:anti-sigma factor [Roseovarius phycicola]|uniref:Regulator of SigK n=1 Tax=Roseovarius phycicola TaxID=3080976 RepID=A0ABZ2HEW0_9RHOB